MKALVYLGSGKKALEDCPKPEIKDQTDAIIKVSKKTICGTDLLTLRAASVVNWMVARVAKKSPVVQWGIQEDMHVTGTDSAFEFLQAFRQFQTADVSALIRQDVLLLAGSEDHYVPLEQWHDQMRMLKNAHSITARLFTRGESAQNHCQIGNYGLALRTIVNWLVGVGSTDSPNNHTRSKTA